MTWEFELPLKLVCARFNTIDCGILINTWEMSPLWCLTILCFCKRSPSRKHYSQENMKYFITSDWYQCMITHFLRGSKAERQKQKVKDGTSYRCGTGVRLWVKCIMCSSHTHRWNETDACFITSRFDDSSFLCHVLHLIKKDGMEMLAITFPGMWISHEKMKCSVDVFKCQVWFQSS